MNKDQLNNFTTKRSELIGSLISATDKQITSVQKKVLQQILERFVDRLEQTPTGRIANNARNRKLLLEVDQIFADYMKTEGRKTVELLLKSVGSIVSFNQQYFAKIDGSARVLETLPKVKDSLKYWLGIKGDTVEPNGYIDRLIQNDTAKIAIKNASMKIVIGQEGFEDAKKQFKTLIEGNEKTLGAFEKHQRNFAFDLYSQIDRATADVVRSELGFQFAIYEGGLIETSRKFCEKHNGNCYHVSEIEAFEITEARPPNYNPLFDLGGYGCRHHLNWISDAMAKRFRSDADQFINQKKTATPKKKEEEKPIEKPDQKKPEEKEPKQNPIQTPEAKPKPKQPEFDRYLLDQDVEKLPLIKIQEFTTPKRWIDVEKVFAKLEAEFEQRKIDLNKEYENQKKELDAVKLKLGANSDPDKRRIIFEEYNETVKRLNKTIDQINNNTKKKAEAIRAEGQKEFVRMLDEITTPKSDVKFSLKTPNDKNKHFEEIFDIFKRLTGKFELRDNYVVNTDLKRFKNRANYQNTNGANQINILKGQDKGTILHELTHSVENNPFVLKQAVEFLEKRTAGSKIKSLRSVNRAYGMDEKYKEGGFFNPYVGKIYNHNEFTIKFYNLPSYKGYTATEVLTMGVEAMFNNPLKFYKQDPEHFNFIYTLFFKSKL